MARGGRRENAGRPKGTGKPTARTLARQALVAKAEAEGITPLEFMLLVLRDQERPEAERFKAAIEAAPYMHPRLQSTKHQGDAENPLHVVNGIFGFLNGTGRGLANESEGEATGDDGPPRMAS